MCICKEKVNHRSFSLFFLLAFYRVIVAMPSTRARFLFVCNNRWRSCYDQIRRKSSMNLNTPASSYLFSPIISYDTSGLARILSKCDKSTRCIIIWRTRFASSFLKHWASVFTGYEFTCKQIALFHLTKVLQHFNDKQKNLLQSLHQFQTYWDTEWLGSRSAPVSWSTTFIDNPILVPPSSM